MIAHESVSVPSPQLDGWSDVSPEEMTELERAAADEDGHDVIPAEQFFAENRDRLAAAARGCSAPVSRDRLAPMSTPHREGKPKSDTALQCLTASSEQAER